MWSHVQENKTILDLFHVWSSDLDFRSKLMEWKQWHGYFKPFPSTTFQKYLSSLTLWVRWKELPDESRNIPPLGCGSRSACAGCCWRSDKRPFYPVNTHGQCCYININTIRNKKIKEQAISSPQNRWPAGFPPVRWEGRCCKALGPVGPPFLCVAPCR